MLTTLNKLRAHRPCTEGWKKLLAYLGKTEADDEPLNIATVAKSNGLTHAIWALRAVEGHDREIQLFGVWCARQVQHLMLDPRSVAALDITEKYVNNLATRKEFIAALGAAWSAANAARLAANAAWSASDAAWSASDVAWLASDAAWSASDAAWSASDAARSASDVARLAANAARLAANAARSAAKAARSASDVARLAANAAQLKQLLEICEENK